MSKVNTKKINKNIWITDRITEGENRNFKTNTDHHNGDLNVNFFTFFLSFTHFKWLTFKLINYNSILMC